ncbi:hypothetical protein FE782_01755 [Paenibacillus antri]|uniref:Uncharacterized protein n=1 Tax=Paenibacillus antri TaxID=2582848 RepID=A0A5R9GKH4_9BACL|nr:hypothetical protein [Paenibacillus antri]TLS54094.1 hypothetical protein FE782_01755 [Paenibacillus antri]
MAESGEAQDLARGLPGLVHRWRKHQFEAYHLAGQVKHLRQLGLLEERLFARLLDFVRTEPYRIESFYGTLLPHYPDEVRALLLILIEHRADESKERKAYVNVCRIIPLLQKAGGQEEALEVVKRLLFKFPRKPAFREELEKIRR